MQTLLIALCAYLLGSISFAVLVSRLMGLPDPHSYGSKNPGATNVLRSGSKVAAAPTPIRDARKGAPPRGLAGPYTRGSPGPRLRWPPRGPVGLFRPPYSGFSTV